MEEQNQENSESLKSSDGSSLEKTQATNLQEQVEYLKELFRMKDEPQYRMEILNQMTLLNSTLSELKDIMRKGLNSLVQQMYDANKLTVAAQQAKEAQ